MSLARAYNAGSRDARHTPRWPTAWPVCWRAWRRLADASRLLAQAPENSSRATGEQPISALPAHAPHAPHAALATQPALGSEYEGFIRQHERQILNYLWRMVGDEQTAYDLTQEVFLRAWQRYETIRAYESPQAWLFRVASNLAISHLRRHAVRYTSPMPLDDERDPAASDPAGRLAERDLVRTTLLQLSPQRRAALVLCEVYGLKGAEISAALRISETAVRMTLHRARLQFREIYLREGGVTHGA